MSQRTSECLIFKRKMVEKNGNYRNFNSADYVYYGLFSKIWLWAYVKISYRLIMRHIHEGQVISWWERSEVCGWMLWSFHADSPSLSPSFRIICECPSCPGTFSPFIIVNVVSLSFKVTPRVLNHIKPTISQGFLLLILASLTVCFAEDTVLLLSC